MPSTDFDAIDWINSHFHWNNHLKYCDLKPVLGFCLLWNLFEAEQCGKWANPSAISKCVNRLFKTSAPLRANYEDYLEFFRRGYFPTTKCSDKELGRFFQAGKEEDLRQIVCSAFDKPQTDLKTIVHALILLTWRVRNNLFHGEKALYSLPDQVELFNELNSFLATLLDESVVNA